MNSSTNNLTTRLIHKLIKYSYRNAYKNSIFLYLYSLFYSLKSLYFVILLVVFAGKFMKKSDDFKTDLDVEEIKNLCADRDLYKAKFEQAKEECDRLREIIKQFQRHRFGSKSERFVDDPNAPIQGDLLTRLINEEELKNTNDKNAEETETDDKIISIAAYKRRKKKTNRFPNNLPKREVIIEAQDRVCGCGKEKVLLRYEITRLINHIPEVFEELIQKREVLICPCGCSGSITTATNPLRILPKAQVTESFLANVIVSKLHDRQPLYHLEQKFKNRFGFNLSRNKLARWFIDTSKALQPLINLMKDEIINYDVASCDPTSIQVLAEPDRKATQKSYWYCMRGGPPNKKVIVYDYNAKKHKQFLVDWFVDFKGYIHVDAQNIFDDLKAQAEIWLVYCNAHARRKYEPIANGTKGNGLAKEAMKIYRELYRIERHIKDQNYNPSQCFLYRLNTAKPIIDEYQKWLEKKYPTTLPKSSLGKALAYSINHWDGLIRYLNDGRLKIDNNSTEQEIKPAVISRKNFLFAYSVDGARALCIHLSLIRSAILHNFDPYHYYIAVMKAIPYCQTLEDYERLLPWAINLPKVDGQGQQEQHEEIA